jgi:hypothetical protein
MENKGAFAGEIQELSFDEVDEVNGGGAGAVVVAVVVIVVVLLAVGALGEHNRDNQEKA